MQYIVEHFAISEITNEVKQWDFESENDFVIKFNNQLAYWFYIRPMPRTNTEVHLQHKRYPKWIKKTEL